MQCEQKRWDKQRSTSFMVSSSQRFLSNCSVGEIVTARANGRCAEAWNMVVCLVRVRWCSVVSTKPCMGGRTREGSKGGEHNTWILMDLLSRACTCCTGYLLFGLCFPLQDYDFTLGLLLSAISVRCELWYSSLTLGKPSTVLCSLFKFAFIAVLKITCG